MRARQIAVALGSALLCSGFALGQARLGPYVVDSNGLKVGHVQDAHDILMFINETPTNVVAGPSGLTPGTFLQYYTDGACGTQPLFGVVAGDFFSVGLYTTDGVLHYVNAAASVVNPIQSRLTVNTDDSMGPCESFVTGLNSAPVLTASVSFTPPFSVVDSLPVSPAPATATFNDVPTTDPGFRWIEAFAAAGITSGCSVSPPLYCPDNTVTRRQMAVFVAKALGL